MMRTMLVAALLSLTLAEALGKAAELDIQVRRMAAPVTLSLRLSPLAGS